MSTNLNISEACYLIALCCLVISTLKVSQSRWKQAAECRVFPSLVFNKLISEPKKLSNSSSSGIETSLFVINCLVESIWSSMIELLHEVLNSL